MTTKAQERAALHTIEEILSSLGEGSYLGIAFDGCLADAESNIENDFALSMKARWQSDEQRIDTLHKTIDLLKQKRSSEAESNRLIIEDLERKVSSLELDNDIMGKALVSAKQELNEAHDEISELREINENLVSELNEVSEDDFDFDSAECDLDCPFCSGEVFTAEEVRELKRSYHETALSIRNERDSLVEVLSAIKQERDTAEGTLTKLFTLGREEAIAFLDHLRVVNS